MFISCYVFEMSDADSALRERLERTRREAEYTKKKLQQQHEEALEEHETAKKLLERKVSVFLLHGFSIWDTCTPASGIFIGSHTQQQKICTEMFMKIGPAVPEICLWTDKLIAVHRSHTGHTHARDRFTALCPGLPG